MISFLKQIDRHTYTLIHIHTYTHILFRLLVGNIVVFCFVGGGLLSRIASAILDIKTKLTKQQQ